MSDQDTKIFFARQFFNERIPTLKDWIISDIKKCCRIKKDGSYSKNGAMIAAYILWVCAIDYLGGLATNSQKDSKYRITYFTCKYLNYAREKKKNTYDIDQILAMRHGLIHSYSPPNVILSNDQNNTEHLKKYDDFTKYTLGEIIDDLEMAFELLEKDIISDDRKIIKAYNYLKAFPPLSPIA